MKAPRSCRQCRASKRRCTRPGPCQPCDLCRRRGLACGADLRSHVMRLELSAREIRETPDAVTLETSSPSIVSATASNQSHRDVPLPTSTPPSASFISAFPSSTNPAGLPWDFTLRLAELYLDRVHHRQHTMFHPPTLRLQLRNATVPGPLLCGICAIGAKFSPDPNRKALEADLTARAKRLLLADLENICLENIQACILVAAICAGNCQSSSEALFVRIATSLAELMNLASPAPDTPLIAREVACRTWWSLRMADHWCFSGLGMPRSRDIISGSASCDLPMDEIAFDTLPPDQTASSSSSLLLSSSPTPFLAAWKPGIWAHMISLLRLFEPIQDMNRRFARGEVDGNGVRAAADLGQQLETWRDMLPATAQMTVENLDYHQAHGLGGLLVALHLTFHHYSTLLYFRFLENGTRPSPTPLLCIARCRYHASSFSSILRLSRQMRGCRVDYPSVGHMTAVSSSVLVHTLLFGDSQELQEARRALDANFETLVELQQHWPATEAMINRLMVFQNICLSSQESHKLDGWMVRFLLEHSLALRDKGSAFESAGVAVEPDSISSQAQEMRQLGRYTDFTSL